MTKKSEIGKLGEELAVQYLLGKRYKIIERNFWKPWGELDIVSKDKDGTLAFVEVKTLKDYPGGFLEPEDNLTRAKLKKLERTASLYAGARQDLIDDLKGWRIDLIAIKVPHILTNNIDSVVIKHWESISH